MEIKRDILWRVYLSFIAIVLLSFVVLGRAFYIQRVQGSYWRGLSDSLHQRFVELDAERGTIYSEDAQMLSTSIPFFDIYMDFGAEGLRDKKGKRFRENVDSFSIALSRFFLKPGATALAIPSMLPILHSLQSATPGTPGRNIYLDCPLL